MQIWPKDTYKGLTEDVAACERRLAHLLETEPDHEVAIAMYAADARRAHEKLSRLVSGQPAPAQRAFVTRLLVDGVPTPFKLVDGALVPEMRHS